DAALHPLQKEIPRGALTAFLAQELDGFEMGESVRAAWDLDTIRSQHRQFADDWAEPPLASGSTPALTTRTMLVADWLNLLRADPGLPRDYLGDNWPADESASIFRSRRRELATPSTQEFVSR